MSHFRLSRVFRTGLVCVGLLLATDGFGQEKAAASAQQSMSFWMKKKLDYSQGILEGVSLADFDKIAANAEQMRNLSKVEGFIRRSTPGYAAQLQIFDEAAAEILRQANRDNLDGAALALTQLTISCVNCHKRLREAK